MWYIMDCDEDANIIVGFSKEVSQSDYVKALENGSVLDILNSEKIKTGDTFYIPTGRVHAIGAGTVLAEIQQTSDVTYRIYDYERLDATTGEQRELHTELALDAIDYKLYDNYKTEYDLKENKASKLILVTAMSPTPAGEGKTTTTIGLADALFSIGKKLFATSVNSILDLKKSSLFFIPHIFPPEFIEGLNIHGTSVFPFFKELLPVKLSNIGDIFSILVFCVTFFFKNGVILLWEKDDRGILSPVREYV